MNFNLNLRFLILLGIILFSGLTLKVHATHIAGGEISYKCTPAPGIIEVTLVVYRICDGNVTVLCTGTCGTTCTNSISITGADGSCNSTDFGSASLSLVSVRDVGAFPQCPAAKNTCNNMGCVTPGTFSPSFERYEFKGFVNIGPTSGIPASCCNVNLSYSSCCRGAYNTSNVPQSTFYIDATINRCLAMTPCNSSPSFSSDPFIISNAGDAYIHSNAGFDPDDDSLSFNFAPILQAKNDPLAYNPPFSYDKPMPWSGPATALFPSGIHCDPHTGEVSFTPGGSAGSFTGNICIEVKQWKRIGGVPTLIATTRREVLVALIGNSGPNIAPSIQTTPPDAWPNTPKTQWQVCAGNQLCFTVTAKDTNPTDTTYLVWDSTLAVKGATFLPTYTSANRSHPDPSIGGPREDSYQFCWNTTNAMARENPYLFSVVASDRYCPSPGKISKTFSVKVIPRPNISITKNYKYCNKWQLGFTNNNPYQPFSSTSLQVAKEPYDYQFTGGSTVVNNSATLPVLTFSKPGLYLIKLDVQTGDCMNAFYDTLVVDTPLNVKTIDTNGCAAMPITLSATARKGATPYTYSWYHSIKDTASTPLNVNSVSQSDFTTTANATQYFVVLVKDAFGCRAVDSTKVTIKNSIKQVTVTAPKCNGDNNGSILVTVNDTNQLYQYKLNNGIFQLSGTFSNLSAGSYTLTVKDTTTCNSIQTVIVNQPAIIKDTLSQLRHQTCIGLNNGSISVKLKGGTPPYLFSLDNIQFDTTTLFTSLSPGLYTVHVKDSNNCYAAFGSTILAADSLKYHATVKNNICSGGTGGEIKLSVTGGKKPYRYQLDTGAIVSDSTFKNLTAKTYTLIIRDTHNCVLSFNQPIWEPTPIIITSISKNTTCYGGNDGSIKLNVNGGVPPYAYRKNINPGFDTVTLFNNLNATLHQFTIRDSLNCTLPYSAALQQPSRIEYTFSTLATSCGLANGQIDILASGGTPPYMYAADSGVFSTQSTLTNLPEGTHQFIIRDSALCQRVFAAAISTAPKMTVKTTLHHINCINQKDGKISLTALLGAQPFAYSLNGGPYTSSSTFSNLDTGKYIIGIKDFWGCTDSITAVLTTLEPFTAGDITGSTTGIVNVIDSFSVVPQPGLNYKWSTPKGTILNGQTTPTIYVRWDTAGTSEVNVIVYRTATCADTGSITVAIGVSGLNELVQDWGLQVYPNPTSNILHIQFKKLPSETALELYDMHTKLVFQQKLSLSQQINIESLTPGIYILKIGAWTGKIVKE